MAAQISDIAVTVQLADVAATHEFAARLAHIAQPGDVFALIGDLGMGKTTFARGFIRALAALNKLPDEDVPSPTFTLVQSYPMTGFTVYHFDLYRLDRPEEAIELGIDDAFAEGISLIEWSNRLGDLLPEDRLDISLLPGDGEDTRQAVITAHGKWSNRLDQKVLYG